MTFYDFLSLKNDVSVPSKIKKLKKSELFLRLEGHCRKEQDADQRYGFAIPDPNQNITDPEHCNWNHTVPSLKIPNALS